jgi:hypothetical protein
VDLDTSLVYTGPVITKELLCALFEYQPDGRLLRRITSNPRAKAGTYSGSVGKGGYLRTQVAGKLYFNHRLVWLMHRGSWPKNLDHINGNKLDNRIENLRECTQTQNMQNCPNKKSNTTSVKGVGWRPSRGKFRARIVVNGKEICVGHFLELEEAAKAVQEARTKYHGEFARHE